jgi:hypothetical protein
MKTFSDEEIAALLVDPKRTVAPVDLIPPEEKRGRRVPQRERLGKSWSRSYIDCEVLARFSHACGKQFSSLAGQGTAVVDYPTRELQR